MFDDNFSYLIVDDSNMCMSVVDPADPKAVQRAIQDEPSSYELISVLTTHKHWDHAGGNIEMAKQYPGVEIFGPATESIPGCTRAVLSGDVFKIGNMHVDVSAYCHVCLH